MRSIISYFRNPAAGRLIRGGAIGALVAGLLIMSTVPGFAQAEYDGFTSDDAAAWFSSETGDPYSSVFLNQIFGPLFPSADGGGAGRTFLSTIIGFFNVICLAVGGLLFFYNVLVGVLQSAHEGVILGQRWSTLWGPLRVILAVGMLVPLPGLSGYNVLQATIAIIVKGSTEGASFIWGEATELLLDDATPIIAANGSMPADVTEALWQMSACLALSGYQYGVAGGTPPQPVQQQSENGRYILTTALGDNRTGICGSIRTPRTPAALQREETKDLAPEFQAIQRDALIAGLQVFASMAGDFVKAALAGESPPVVPVRQAHAAMRDVYDERMESLRRKLASDDGQTGRARDMLARYISGGNCGRRSSNPEAVECFGQGWIGAGSWYMTVARLNAEILTVLQARPDVVNGPSYFANTVEVGALTNWNPFSRRAWSSIVGPTDEELQSTAEARKVYAAADWGFQYAAAELAALGYPLNPDLVQDAQADDSSGGWASLIDKAFTGRGVDAANFLAEIFDPSRYSEDPMVGIVRLGHRLTDATAALIIGISLGSFFTSAAGALLQLPLATLLAAGTSMAFILPMLPFILWVISVTGYFLLVAEAIVAANLWAIAHLRMEGEGFAGQSAQQGYLLILSLFLTPILMIFGFLIGMMIFKVTSAIIDMGFYYMLSSLGVGGSLSWLFGIIAVSVMIVLSYIVLIERSFSLVSEFPNRVLRWIGGSADVSSNEGRAQQAALGSAIVTGGAGAQATQGAATGFGRGVRAGARWAGRNRNRASDDSPPPGD
ncbi:DotA/TraY family protein [Amorphus sp. 3PC139-8]|uniref:DotA/TraY family protein n=1 Tax=Amorphus sp. 3PC139-8 TaxID=2735676 RepID=UPI00345D8D95